MNDRGLGPTRFWTTVRLLLGVAKKRSSGRRRRQGELLHTRSQGKGTDWSSLGSAFFVLFMLVLNGMAAFVVQAAVEAAQRVEVERQGKIVVSSSFLEMARGRSGDSPLESSRSDEYADEAKGIAEKYGGSQPLIEQQLRNAVFSRGAADLVSSYDASPGLSALAQTGPLAAMFGSIFLLIWAAMLALQGEGLEMDVQRRRHPIWEWLFSHPVPPGAVFLAEMLSPIAANSVYWGAPLFAGLVYGFTYGAPAGFFAAFVIGVPVTISLACLGKALETGVILRFPPRTRGAMIGLMSWLGYTALMLFFVGVYLVPRFVTMTARFAGPLTAVPWPWLGLFVGEWPGRSMSLPLGVLACWLACGLTITGSVWFSVWATNKGLSGSFAADAPKSSANKSWRMRFGRDPLYRKEFLWFARDRSAIVQTLLVPLSIAGLQVFNLRTLLVHAQGEWNYLSGVAIFFGTYFLWILGPKSLQSEGTALWIPLTWPRGLESLLKAKARLWSLISCGLVAMVLGYAVVVFRSDAWRIALVGAGWFFFSRSMAEKSVTLVTVTASSGEPEKVPKGRRWAAQLGMLTFAIGIITQQWQLAIMGIVYSYITAAAMWQNFRARLPYLYDPWSERLPRPPTLMHAMISISVLVEMTAVLSIPFMIAGRENLAMGQAIGYGLSALIISVIVSHFLSERDVRPQDIWCWLPDGESIEESESVARRYGVGDVKAIPALLAGACGGLVLGIFAQGYMAALRLFPAMAELIRKSQEQMAGVPNLRLWYTIMAVGFAPFAEEYLFRGLLFRALDAEWGGWRAIVGSGAFFAIYHPPLSWVPVFLLGAGNAWLFKKTRRLAPAVVLHMVYNFVVLVQRV